MPSILVFCRDSRLLETRQWVLEAAGFRVFTAIAFPQAREVMATEALDLLLLCHSLTAGERFEALATANTVRPGMKILLVTALESVDAIAGLGPTVSCFEGPRGLLAATREVLSSVPV